MHKKTGHFIISLSDGKILTSYSVILAAGSNPGLLGVPGEKEFVGKGVSYCATCDGQFFKDKKMFIVGGGDAACEEARYLSNLSDKIVLVHRRDKFRAQEALVERVVNDPHIKVRFNTVIKEIKGEQKVKSVVLSETTSDKVYEEETDAVFIFVGTVPQTSLVAGDEFKAKLDESGYIITNQKMFTSIAGLFAAGDLRSGSFRQVVTAAADGAIAAHSAVEYIDAIKNRLLKDKK